MKQVLHSCLVEDTALFLRHVLEKLTREKQDDMFAILRRLLRFVAYLPQQTAFTIHNYLIGYIMFYVRTPMEGSQDLVGNALSLLSMVRHDLRWRPKKMIYKLSHRWHQAFRVCCLRI